MTAATAALAFFLSLTFVAAVRRYALARLLDHPTERSSHIAPVPRGGGLAAVGALAGTVLVLGPVLHVPLRWLVATEAALVVVAVIGSIDDHGSLPIAPRLVAHGIAGLLVAYLAASLAVAGPVPYVVWLAWWWFWTVSAINVVNFMDGIDGLIGSQTVLFGVYLALAAPWPSFAAGFGLCLAGAWLGFLVWNWPPARIFMGDVGSGTTGLAMVVGGVWLMASDGTGLVRAFLPLLPMFLDALVTLVRRARRGERLTAPHRSHLYQRLANGGWGHGRVSALYFLAAAAGTAIALAAPRGAPFAAVVGVYTGVLMVVGRVLDVRAGRDPASADPSR